MHQYAASAARTEVYSMLVAVMPAFGLHLQRARVFSLNVPLLDVAMPMLSCIGLIPGAVCLFVFFLIKINNYLPRYI